MLPADLAAEAARLLQRCRERRWTLATAESCTGGLIAGCLTAVAGASDVLDRGFVTYSNTAKEQVLGVPEATLATHGAVSEPVARAMAAGALARSEASAAVSATGVAGPGGSSAGKPVGLVHLAVACRDGRVLHRRVLYGDLGRDGIRLAAVRTAFEMLDEAVGGGA